MSRVGHKSIPFVKARRPAKKLAHARKKMEEDRGPSLDAGRLARRALWALIAWRGMPPRSIQRRL